MRRGRSTGKLTQAQLARFRALQAHGCIACRMIGFWRVAEMHHICEGRRRLGHLFTIPLCPYHHRNVGGDPTLLGPSLATNKRVFTERFGTERALWQHTNELLGLNLEWPQSKIMQRRTA